MIIDILVMLIYLAVSSATILFMIGRIFGYEKRQKQVPFYILSAAGAAITVLMNFAVPAEEVYYAFDLFLFAFLLAVPYSMFKPRKKFVFFFFSSLIAIVFDYLRSFVVSLIPSGDFGDRLEALISVSIYSAVLILLIIFNKKFARRIPDDFIEGTSPILYIALYISYFSASTEAMLGVDEVYDPAMSKILKLVSSGLIIFCVIYLIYRYISVSVRQKESEMQLEIELNHYEDMMKRDRDIRAFRHDYKNNILSISALVEGGKTDEAKKYLKELYDGLETTAIRFSTGNYLADAIISEKAAKAAENGNSIEFSGILPRDKISNNDLCTILSNVLDNAIRACEDNSPSVIKIDSSLSDMGAVITVSNPVRERVIIKDNSIKTTKSDTLNHGIGISNIKKTAAKYDGDVRLLCDDTTFTFEITVCF